jgi:hypothetical protein
MRRALPAKEHLITVYQSFAGSALQHRISIAQIERFMFLVFEANLQNQIVDRGIDQIGSLNDQLNQKRLQKY